MEVKLPTEGTRYVQALLLTATAYLQYRAHFLPAVAAYRGYGRPAVPKVSRPLYLSLSLRAWD